jgi:hypothetical protein
MQAPSRLLADVPPQSTGTDCDMILAMKLGTRTVSVGKPKKGLPLASMLSVVFC